MTGRAAGRSEPPRYSARPLPPYRFLPGRAPHPRRDPRGHSHGLPEPAPAAPAPHAWDESDWYLYGADLFNCGFWWEAHEVFESLWHAVGHQSEQGRFFRALVQVAGASLKRESGNQESAAKLADNGLRRLAGCPASYMGLDVRELAEAVRAYFHGAGARRPLLRLAVTSPRPADPE